MQTTAKFNKAVLQSMTSLTGIEFCQLRAIILFINKLSYYLLFMNK